MILSKNVLNFSKNIFVRGAFLWKITADAVGATSCRPVRRNGVMKNGAAIGSRMFFSHADFTELAEAHLLCVLALRDVCVMKHAGWFREICVFRVKLICVRAMPDVYIRPSWGDGPT